MRQQKEMIILVGLALLVCQFLLSVNIWANDDPPIIRVIFDIQAKHFRFNLSDDGVKRRVEMEIAGKLAALGNEWFPFVEWKPMDEPVDSDEAEYWLKLTLEGEDNCNFAQDIYLTYSAGTMGKTKRLLKTPRKQLYKQIICVNSSL